MQLIENTGEIKKVLNWHKGCNLCHLTLDMVSRAIER